MGNKEHKELERLVFCKDCRWWEGDRNGRCKLYSFDMNSLTVMKPDDFCSRGVRKEKEE